MTGFFGAIKYVIAYALIELGFLYGDVPDESEFLRNARSVCWKSSLTTLGK